MIVFLLMNGYATAQNPLQVQAVPQFYGGGYNISCFGGNNGRINTQVTGGVPPYTYQWSNGAGSVNLTNASAGVYSVTVTDAQNNTTNAQVELYQPRQMQVEVHKSDYNGFNISRENLNNGYIELEVGGGNTPYNVQWSNNQIGLEASNLLAGNYQYTLTDMSGCLVSGTVNLNQPGPFTATASVTQHISCFRLNDGKAIAQGNGGQPPYSYQWDNGQFTDTTNNLGQGEHKVVVTDANRARVELSVFIVMPNELNSSATASIYPEGYNTSCFDCCNGIITSNTTGGTPPYTYQWSNSSQTTSVYSAACEGFYTLNLLDSKGCKFSTSTFITAPKANNWNLTGNTNSDPASQFIGTSDQKDLVFKTNNTETFRLGADGKARFANGFKVNAFANGALGQDKFSIAAFNQFGEQIATNLLVQRTGTNGQAFLIQPDQLADIDCPPGIAMAPYWAQSPNKLVTAPTQCQDNVKVGIGVANPTQKLEVNGNGHFYGKLFVNEKAIIGASTTGYQWDNNDEPTLYMNNTGNSSALYINALGKNDYSFIQQIKTDNPKAKAFNIDLNNQSTFTVYGNGNVVIGGSSVGNAINNSKLMVDGLIATKEVRVMLTDFPDYVFEDDYCKDDLEQVAEYIEVNKHLPGMISAKEVKENGGFELGAVQLMTIEKLEELYLHVIQLNERIKALEKENANLKNAK